MLWFSDTHTDTATREELLSYAERYFYKYQGQLSSGMVKGMIGKLHITIAFTVEEEERR